MRKVLEHDEQQVAVGDRIKLQFPEDQSAVVTVVLFEDDRLIVSEDKLILEFVRIHVPFDLANTVLGDVCGELKMWQSTTFPGSAPAMIVANLH